MLFPPDHTASQISTTEEFLWDKIESLEGFVYNADTSQGQCKS